MGKVSKKYLNKVVVLQKRVLRLIYFTDRKEHAIPSFVNEKFQLSITLLHYDVVCKLLLDVRDDSPPFSVMKIFTRRSNIHSHTTRSSTSQLFNAKSSRLKMQSKSFSRIGVRIWKETPNENQNYLRNPSKRNKRVFLQDQRCLYWAWQTQIEAVLQYCYYTKKLKVFISLKMNFFHFTFSLLGYPFNVSLCIVFLHFWIIFSIIILI